MLQLKQSIGPVILNESTIGANEFNVSKRDFRAVETVERGGDYPQDGKHERAGGQVERQFAVNKLNKQEECKRLATKLVTRKSTLHLQLIGWLVG